MDGLDTLETSNERMPVTDMQSSATALSDKPVLDRNLEIPVEEVGRWPLQEADASAFSVDSAKPVPENTRDWQTISLQPERSRVADPGSMSADQVTATMTEVPADPAYFSTDTRVDEGQSWKTYDTVKLADTSQGTPLKGGYAGMLAGNNAVQTETPAVTIDARLNSPQYRSSDGPESTDAAAQLDNSEAENGPEGGVWIRLIQANQSFISHSTDISMEPGADDRTTVRASQVVTVDSENRSPSPQSDATKDAPVSGHQLTDAAPFTAPIPVTGMDRNPLELSGNLPGASGKVDGALLQADGLAQSTVPPLLERGTIGASDAATGSLAGLPLGHGAWPSLGTETIDPAAFGKVGLDSAVVGSGPPENRSGPEHVNPEETIGPVIINSAWESDMAPEEQLDRHLAELKRLISLLGPDGQLTGASDRGAGFGYAGKIHGFEAVSQAIRDELIAVSLSKILEDHADSLERFEDAVRQDPLLAGISIRITRQCDEGQSLESWGVGSDLAAATTWAIEQDLGNPPSLSIDFRRAISTGEKRLDKTANLREVGS